MPGFEIDCACNNRCVMCTNPVGFSKKRKDFSFEIICSQLNKFFSGEDVYLDNFRDAFYIGGGEPTLVPFLFKVVDHIRKHQPGVKICILTNGRAIANRAFAKKLMGIPGPLEIIVPVHAPVAKDHDRITGVRGSFQQTIQGLKNILALKQPGQSVEIRHVIHRLNFKHLNEMSYFMITELFGIDRLVYIFFEIDGMARVNLKRINLRYQDLAPFFEKMILAKCATFETRFYHFPLCQIPARFWPYVFRSLAKDTVQYVKACMKCPMKSSCLGIQPDYLEANGAGEFHPVVGVKVSAVDDWTHPIREVFV